MEEFKLYINGKWTDTKSGQIKDDICPWDQSVYAKYHTAGPEEVEAAIQAAVAAQPAWADTHMSVKEKIILKAADYMEANIEKFGMMLVNDSGSTLMKGMDEVAQTVQIVRSAAAECRQEFGGVINTDTTGDFSYWYRYPMGVIAGIGPFNYPLLLTLTKAVFAIAAGNAFILKPSSDAPACGAIIAECFDAAGLPAGIYQSIPGPGAVVGDALVEDPRIKKITFTGSTAVGTEIGIKAAKTLKTCTLEMGGKNPCIVLKDFDIEKAINVVLFGGYFHQGQICMATNRVIVEEPIYEEFCQKLKARVEKLKTGDKNDPLTIVGPLINPKQCLFIASQIDDAVSKGARLLTGGTYDGAFFKPSLLCDVTPEMSIFYEESFGPITSVVKAKDSEDALALCNNNKYGLSSALLTNDLQKAFSMAKRMEAGMVHINDSTVMGARSAPFGGIKNSGYGREGGHFSMEEFSYIKWVTIRYEGGGFPPM